MGPGASIMNSGCTLALALRAECSTAVTDFIKPFPGKGLRESEQNVLNVSNVSPRPPFTGLIVRIGIGKTLALK